MEIMFEDLNPNTQKKVLEFYGITDVSETNWDIFPLMILER